MNGTVTLQRHNGDLRMMVGVSAVIHVAVFLLLTGFHLSPRFTAAPVYYVDILDLPVANPQAGRSAGNETPLPSPQPAQPVLREMTLPAKPHPKQPPVPAKPEPTRTARDVEERIARLENEAAARHQAAAIDALRKKGTARAPAGMPGATGTEAGSDYASYIKSRLEDEFRTTISFQSRNPEVIVRLVISRQGRVVRQQVIRSSGDRIFEDAVTRTIMKAERNFVPPPTDREFEITVKFSPRGIGKQ